MITFLVYTDKREHIKPIPLEEAVQQELINIPHEILHYSELMGRVFVKPMNKPILKKMTLIHTPAIGANDWIQEEHIMLLTKHATKILFLVNDMHAGGKRKASKRLLEPAGIALTIIRDNDTCCLLCR